MTDETLSNQEMDDFTRQIAKPTLFMIRTENQTDTGVPGCFYGGQPTLPSDIDWPVFHCPSPPVDIPMQFICQIDFEQVPRLPGLPDFPEGGTLFVFIETLVAAEYFLTDVEPEHLKEDALLYGEQPLLTGEGACVIYVPDSVSHCPPRQIPPLPHIVESPSLQTDTHIQLPEYRQQAPAFAQKWPFTFVVGETYPDRNFLTQKGEFDNLDRYFCNRDFLQILEAKIQDIQGQARDGINGDLANFRPPHYLFGAPDFYTYFNKDSVRLDLFPNHQVLTDEHIPLIHFESQDPALGYDYGSSERISIWITKDDLKECRLEEVQFWSEN